MINCEFCPCLPKGYTLKSCRDIYLEIDGKFYKRDRGNIFDDRNERPDLYSDDIPLFDPDCEPDCHDCGVPFGNVHHVGCDSERCPRCKGQLISCNCGVDRTGTQKRVIFYDSLPSHATPRRVNRKSLAKFIER